MPQNRRQHSAIEFEDLPVAPFAVRKKNGTTKDTKVQKAESAFVLDSKDPNRKLTEEIDRSGATVAPVASPGVGSVALCYLR